LQRVTLKLSLVLDFSNTSISSAPSFFQNSRVSEENAAGISFHKSLGFQKISVLPKVGFKFGRFLDLVLMQKKLVS
tara:strand:- start:450 stop:677 length:228 start_codon:yes stop_codon:yes gene_type:complete